MKYYDKIKMKTKKSSNLLAIYCVVFKFEIILRTGYPHHENFRIQSIFLNLVHLEFSLVMVCRRNLSVEILFSVWLCCLIDWR